MCLGKKGGGCLSGVRTLPKQRVMEDVAGEKETES